MTTAAAGTAYNLAFLQARRLELHDHPAPPPGAEVHAAGIRHEVQRGDSATAIARDYSQAYHMDISARSLTDANAAAFADGLRPGELLRIPGLEARFDSMIGADDPNLVRSGSQLRHGVHRGETLSSIARHYRETDHVRLTWQELYAANRATIGSNPDRLKVGQQLVVPGITTAGPRQSLQSLAELDGDVVLTRMGRLQQEFGGISQEPVIELRADAAHAVKRASVDDAVAAARTTLAKAAGRAAPIAVVQTRDGAVHTVPLRATEAGGLDDSTRTLSLAYRADERGVLAVVSRDAGDTAVTVRRFDQ